MHVSYMCFINNRIKHLTKDAPVRKYSRHRPCTVLRCHHPAPECSPRWDCRGVLPPSTPGWRCCSRCNISPVAAEALPARMVLSPLEREISEKRMGGLLLREGSARGGIEGERQRGRCKQITGCL